MHDALFMACGSCNNCRSMMELQISLRCVYLATTDFLAAMESQRRFLHAVARRYAALFAYLELGHIHWVVMRQPAWALSKCKAYS